MSLNDSDIEDISLPGAFTIRSQINSDTKLPELKSITEFFDTVCDPDWKRGECSSYLVEADVELEGVLDEDSSDNLG